MSGARVALPVAIVALLASGCSGSDSVPGAIDTAPPVATTEPHPPNATPPAAAGISARAERQRPVRLLTAIELRRIWEVAARIEGGLIIFERRTANCAPRERASCLELAWQGIVGDLLGSQWDLIAFRDLPRICATLDAAVEAILGFNLARTQLDYGDPAEIGQPSQRAAYLPLVDTLRPVPGELRAAAAAQCQV